MVARLLIVIGTLNEKHPRILIGSWVLLLLVSILFSTRVNIESYLFEELAEDDPIVQANQIMEEQMTGILTFEMQVAAGEPEGALEPDFLARLDGLESFVASQPWIRKTLSIVDILKEMNQAMHGGDPVFYRVPETRELIAQYLLLYEASGNQEDIDVLLTPDGSYRTALKSGRGHGNPELLRVEGPDRNESGRALSPPPRHSGSPAGACWPSGRWTTSSAICS